METLADSTTTVLDRLAHAAKVVEGLDIPDAVQTSVSVVRYPNGGGRVEIHAHCPTLDVLRELRRTVGTMEKDSSGAAGRVLLRGEVGGVKVTLWPPAETCKQVQVGTETVTREVPVQTKTVTAEVPVYEWDCGPVLADEPQAVA